MGVVSDHLAAGGSQAAEAYRRRRADADVVSGRRVHQPRGPRGEGEPSEAHARDLRQGRVGGRLGRRRRRPRGRSRPSRRSGPDTKHHQHRPAAPASNVTNGPRTIYTFRSGSDTRRRICSSRRGRSSSVRGSGAPGSCRRSSTPAPPPCTAVETRSLADGAAGAAAHESGGYDGEPGSQGLHPALVGGHIHGEGRRPNGHAHSRSGPVRPDSIIITHTEAAQLGMGLPGQQQIGGWPPGLCRQPPVRRFGKFDSGHQQHHGLLPYLLWCHSPPPR